MTQKKQSAITNQIKTQYPIKRLYDVGVILYDCDHRTPKPTITGYPYIAIPQIQQGRLDLSEVRYISKEDFESWTQKNKPQTGDIIVTRRARVGDTAVIPEGLECAIGQNLVILRSDGSQVDQTFLRWSLRGPFYEQQMSKFLNVGAVFDSLNCGDIPQFELPIPPLPTQHAIARILGSLDNKIELNWQINETLEAMARAIFQSWFVDFDPVRAKAEGRETGLPPEIAMLFPSDIVEVDGREVPKGWGVGTLEEIADNIRKPINPDQVDPDTPYIGLEHMPQHSIALSECGLASSVGSGKFQFFKGDFLFGKLRPYFHKVGIAPVDGVCSTDILIINPRKDLWSAYTICCISSDEFVEFANLGSDGTRMPRSSWAAMKKYHIAIPEERIATAFNAHMQPLFSRINANIHESRTLGQIRDALLPKLMSGNVKV